MRHAKWKWKRKRNSGSSSSWQPMWRLPRHGSRPFSKELAGQVVQEQTGLSLTGKKPRNQEGQPELDKLIQSMDKQIQQQEDKEKQMREEIDSDILSAIKKVNLSRKYTLIFRNPRANISADDITDEVNTVVQQIVY